MSGNPNEGHFFVPNANLTTFQDSIEAILSDTNERAMMRTTKDIGGTTYRQVIVPVRTGHRPSWKTALAAAGGHGYFLNPNMTLGDATTPSGAQQLGTAWSYSACVTDIGAQQPTLVLYIDDSLASHTSTYDPAALAGSRHTGGSAEGYPSLASALSAMQTYRRTELILRNNGNMYYPRYHPDFGTGGNPGYGFYAPATKPITLRSYTEADERAEVGVHPDDIAYFNPDLPDTSFTAVPIIRLCASGCIIEDIDIHGLADQGLAGRYDYNDVGVGNFSSDPVIYDTIVRRNHFRYNRHCALKGSLRGVLVEQNTFRNIGGMQYDHVLYMTVQDDPERPLIMRWNFADMIAGEFLRGVVDAATDYYYEVYANVLTRCITGGIEIGNYGWGKIANNTIVLTSTENPPVYPPAVGYTGSFRINGRTGSQTQIIVNNLITDVLGWSFTLGNSHGWNHVYGTLGDNWLKETPGYNGQRDETEAEFDTYWHGDGSDHIAAWDGAFTPDYATPAGTEPQHYALDTALDAGRDASSLIPDLRLLDAALTASNGYPTPEASYSASSVGAFAVSA